MLANNENLRKSKIRLLAGLIIPLIIGIVGCEVHSVPTNQGSSSSDSAFIEEHNVKELMELVLEPAADHIWDSAGFILTESETIDLSPTTDEGWQGVRDSAAVLVESANLLLLPHRKVDDTDWVELSKGLAYVGQLTTQAAQAQDADALFQAGAAVYNVCVACHTQYWVERPVQSENQ